MFTKLRTALAVLVLSVGVASAAAPSASAHHISAANAYAATNDLAAGECWRTWPSSCWQVRYIGTSLDGEHTRVMSYTIHSSVHTRYWVLHYYVGHTGYVWKMYKLGVG